MTSFSELLSNGHGWLFIPTAVVLGALHGLEPGHSKTMMAAFIISIRGTIGQAILLGLSATLSHTAVIWLLAFIGLHYSKNMNVETTEPYFQLASGLIIVALAIWMFLRTARERGEAKGHADSHGPHGGTMVDTGHGLLELSVFETGVPPRFRIHSFGGNRKAVSPPEPGSVKIQTIRPNGDRENFEFQLCEDGLESKTNIPEPHEFTVKISIGHHGHSHTYEVPFTEEGHHHHDIAPGEDFEDAHQRAHSQEIAERFSNRTVTTGQIVIFGLTGGLLPCPAAFSILLVCLQLKQFVLGFSMVLAFSLGLAITLVTVGSVAAFSVNHARKRFTNIGGLLQKVPYLSSGFMVIVGLFVAFQGARHFWK